jgi:hypothetical protein
MPRQRGDVRQAIRAPSKDEIAPDHHVRHLTPSSYQKTLTTKDAMPHNKPRTLVLGATARAGKRRSDTPTRRHADTPTRRHAVSVPLRTIAC